MNKYILWVLSVILVSAISTLKEERISILGIVLATLIGMSILRFYP